jgi:NADH-quinone oxidoreductase subunit M
LLILLPLIGIPLLWLSPRPNTHWYVGLSITLLNLALSLLLLHGFHSGETGMQWTEQVRWLGALGSHYQLGVDGISVLFIPLTSLLFVLRLVSLGQQPRGQIAALLLLESILIGAFSAIDLILFFLFWELMLVPSWLLIALYGSGHQRRETATRYCVYMLAASAPLLLGFAMLAGKGSLRTFHLSALADTPVDPSVQGAAFFLLLIGFGAKAPLFLLHSWLRPVVCQGPTGVAVVMVGLKLGVFGMMRILIPLLPHAAEQYAPLVIGLAVVGVIYGSVVAYTLADLKSVMAATTLSHVGLIVVGLFAADMQGLEGALLQTLNLGLTAGGLMFLAAAVQQRSGSLDASALGGLATRMPRMTGLFVFFAMASIGLPGTSGFPAELLIFLGAFQTHPVLGSLALTSVVLSAACILRFVALAFWGRPRPDSAWMPDISPRELVVVSTLAILVLGVGLYPNAVLRIARASLIDAHRLSERQRIVSPVPNR